MVERKIGKTTTRLVQEDITLRMFVPFLVFYLPEQVAPITGRTLQRGTWPTTSLANTWPT